MRVGWEHTSIPEAPAMLDASPNKKGANDVVFMKDFRASSEVDKSRALSLEPDDLADALAVTVPKCRRRCCFLITQRMDFGRCCRPVDVHGARIGEMLQQGHI